ncbi:hypothetical protein G6F68_018473 [Rhizopus microsporus]|nr:hypothetical protein G6F68_018473 [Rhizopus microsporus]
MALVSMEMQTNIETAAEETANIPRMPLLMNSASELLPVGSIFSLASTTIAPVSGASAGCCITHAYISWPCKAMPANVPTLRATTAMAMNIEMGINGSVDAIRIGALKIVDV